MVPLIFISPGIFRLMSLAWKTCSLLPEQFEENLQRLFSHMFSAPEELSDDLTRIVAALEKIL